jgi:hypothetical protein
MLLSYPTVLSKIQARQIDVKELNCLGIIKILAATAADTAKATAAATSVAVAVVSAFMADAGAVSMSACCYGF